MSVPETVAAAVVTLQPRRPPLSALAVTLRPRQWTKNLLLFAGVVFAAEIGDGSRWLSALTAFVAYCAASSAAYLLNDLRDVDSDRLHPVKRRRPLARRELPSTVAAVSAAVLCVIALGIAASLGWSAIGFLSGFLALQAAYTLRLKQVVLIDVMAISGLFVIRAAAGADAVDVRISPWLLVCTALLALFLALGKRRAELVLVGTATTRSRPVLAGYSLGLVDQLVGIVASGTLISYGAYALTAHETQALAATIPFVVFGLFRYLVLLDRTRMGEEPEAILVSDLPIFVTVALWAAACATILVVTA